MSAADKIHVKPISKNQNSIMSPPPPPLAVIPSVAIPTVVETLPSSLLHTVPNGVTVQNELTIIDLPPPKPHSSSLYVSPMMHEDSSPRYPIQKLIN